MATDDKTFEQRMARIEALVHQLEQLPDATAREAARETLRSLLELHGAALAKIFGQLAAAGGQAALDACLRDDLVRSLLLLHDLHPETLETRVQQALEKVRPYLHSHGGDVELLEVSPAAVRLRMEGSCHGCPSSAATLRDTIERSICEFAPDVAAIDVEGLSDPSAPAGLVSLQLPQNDHPHTNGAYAPNGKGWSRRETATTVQES